MKKHFLFLIILIYSSCKQPTEIYIEIIPEGMKPYIMFPVGSYWVYEDSATLLLDSFYLREFNIDTFPINNCIECTNKDYYQGLNQNFYNENGDDNTVIAHTDVFHSKYYRYKAFFKDFFQHDIPENEFVLYDDDTLKTIELMDSVQLSGKMYYDLIVQGYNDVCRSYWCENIGLIRREVYKIRQEPLGAYIDTLIIKNLKNYYIN